VGTGARGGPAHGGGGGGAERNREKGVEKKRKGNERK
jgi:hypothetical protein